MRAASGVLEEEETHAHSSLPSTLAGRRNLRRTVGWVAMQANLSSNHSPIVCMYLSHVFRRFVRT